MHPLTDRQSTMLAFLRDYVAAHGYAPTLREIADAHGLRSLATVHAHLTVLEVRGLIRRGWNFERGIELTGACPYCGRGEAKRAA